MQNVRTEAWDPAGAGPIGPHREFARNPKAKARFENESVRVSYLSFGLVSLMGVVKIPRLTIIRIVTS